jgi:hypothetical protein
MLVAAQQFLEAYRRRSLAAQQIGALASTVARIRPGDVGPYTKAEQAVRELTRLVNEGEPAPALLRYPGQPQHGNVPEAVPA